MDKKTVIGLVLIGVILLGYSIINRPSKEKLIEQKRIQDSIRQVKKNDSIQAALAANELNKSQDTIDSNSKKESTQIENNDSINSVNIAAKYGVFANAAKGENSFYIVENEKMIITFSAKGGRVYSVELKDYKTYDSLPVILFSGDTTQFGLDLMIGGAAVFTNDLYFTPVDIDAENKIDATKSEKTIAMRLYAGEDKYIEFRYLIKPNDYMIDFKSVFHNMESVLSQNISFYKMRWSLLTKAFERGRKWELNNTTIYLKMDDNEIEYLKEQKASDEFKSVGKVHWIAFKQQFFSSAIIMNEYADGPVIKLNKVIDENSPFLKHFYAEVSFPIKRESHVEVPMQLYFGPNKFNILKKYDIKLEKLVPLGWGIFGWFNRFLIIPIFNWLGGFISSYGIIILLLTIIIKILLFPLTYKSYLSTAKMKVLKPQIDELSKKYPKGKEMEKQQAVMALYKRAGVNPMGGCLPMLLQFPILIALFRFFPASIELRQQSFLWADDLSTYDSILDLSFNIPFYGSHISLFTLLMAAALMVSTIMTNKNQPTNNQMPGMKVMMYFMPIMLLFFFNDYAAGLSYYYFLANLFTILQTWAIRRFFVDDEKVLAKLEENKKKPIKKSNWQVRLEEAAKKRGIKR